MSSPGSSGSPRLHFEVTGIMTFWVKPVGIARIEYEACRHLLATRPDTVFCVYDKQALCYRQVAPTALNKKLSAFGEAKDIAPKSPPPPPHRPVRTIIRQLLPPILKNSIAFCMQQLRQRRTGPEPAPTDAIHPVSGDVFIWFGIGFDDNVLDNLSRMASAGVRMVYYNHDIIPAIFPQFAYHRMHAEFRKFATTMARTAFVMLFNSECSRKDFVQFSASLMQPARRSLVVPPAISLLPEPTTEAISASLADATRKPYILFVSTLEARKNHDLLYKVWLYLLSMQYPDIPALIFVGNRGWGTENLLYNLSTDSRVEDRIILLDNVNDSELGHLYANCLFTVYPSFYEGWGMPISESLAMGKHCLISGDGATAEAGAGLADVISPYNVAAWADAIMALVRNPALLAEKEARIRACYSPRLWSDFCQEAFDFVLSETLQRDTQQ